MGLFLNYTGMTKHAVQRALRSPFAQTLDDVTVHVLTLTKISHDTVSNLHVKQCDLM